MAGNDGGDERRAAMKGGNDARRVAMKGGNDEISRNV